MLNKYKFWLYLLLSGLVVYVLVTLLLTFSPYMARYESSMKIRGKYVSALFNIRKTLGYGEADFCWYFKNPVSPLRKNDDGTYNYAMVGKIIEVDDMESSITLECSNNKKYKLYTSISNTNDVDWIKIDVGVNTKAEKPRENPITFFKPDINLSFEKDPYFEKNQLYMAIWKDSRELTEINKSIKNKDKSYVNEFDNYILSLLRY